MKRAALIVLLLATIATGVKFVWNTFYDSEDDPSEVFSASRSEARRSGILMSSLLSDATLDQKNSVRLAVAEAWVEQCAVHRYSMVWLHRRVPSDGFTVVIKLAQPVFSRFALWPPERRASFGWISGKYFVRHFDRMPEFPMSVVGGEGRDLVEVLTLKQPNSESSVSP